MQTRSRSPRRRARVVLAAGLALLLAPAAAAVAVAGGNPPVITSISPAAALAGSPGFILQVYGAGFRTGSAVHWNGEPRATERVHNGRLRAVIDDADLAAAGTVQVTVHDPGDNTTSAPVSFHVAPRPVLVSVSPDRVAAGGEPFTLVVEGSGFAPDARIEWGGAPQPTAGTPTRLTATIPPSLIATPRNVPITVVNPGELTAASAPHTLAVVHETPVITGFDPPSVRQGSGGLKLVVRGRGFIRTGTTVLWNGSRRTTTWVSPTEVRTGIAAADLRTSGTARVEVRTDVGRSARTSRAIPFGIDPFVVATPVEPVLAIRSFRLSGGRPFVSSEWFVTLDASTLGTPTVYRAAQRREGCDADLGGAAWSAYSPADPPRLRLTGTGTQHVCFQAGRGGGSAPTATASAEASIRVVRWLITSPLINASRRLLGVLPDAPNQLTHPWGLGVGLEVRAGALLDRIALRSAVLGPDGERSGVRTGTRYGGDGGTLRTLDCPSGQAMVGVRGRRGAVIDRIEVGCRPFSADRGTHGTVSWIGAAGGTGGETSFSFVCPVPHAVFALGAAVTGPYVSGLQLACLPPMGV